MKHYIVAGKDDDMIELMAHLQMNIDSNKNYFDMELNHNHIIWTDDESVVKCIALYINKSHKSFTTNNPQLAKLSKSKLDISIKSDYD